MSNGLLVYLADDHRIVADGIAGLLKSMDKVIDVLVFPDGQQLFQQSLALKPDLVFLDYEMPKWNGYYTLEQLKNRFPDIRCYFLSMVNEKLIIENCIKAGASGFLNKDCSFQELEEAVKSENEIYYSKEVLRSLSGLLITKNSDPILLDVKLTERELEILRYLCDGYNPKEISQKVFLSPRTVETHKNNIMQKFDVNSIGKLLSIALKNNIV
jgi:DNA-binding NarL/FixJ family response regulator